MKTNLSQGWSKKASPPYNIFLFSKIVTTLVKAASMTTTDSCNSGMMLNRRKHSKPLRNFSWSNSTLIRNQCKSKKEVDK